MASKKNKPPVHSPFRSHGKFSTYVEGQIMVTEVTGPWNVELVEEWARHCYPQAKALSDAGPYVGIAVIRESMLCPPSALESLRGIVAYSATKLRCIAHVIVADASVEGRNFVEPTFARIYEGVVAHRIFYTLDEALAWSLALLAERAAQG